MKRYIILYRALQALCAVAQIILLTRGVELCVLMAGGYADGWSASYCLPHILAAGAAIWGLDEFFGKLDDWIEAEKEYARSCRKQLLYDGYLSTQYANRDGRDGRNGGAA